MASPRSATKPRSRARRTSAGARASSRSRAHVENGQVVRRSGSRKDEKDKRKGPKKKKRAYSAKTADKYELYQLAVQSPKEDVAFLDRVYKTYRKKKALHFREDFCGTGLLSATWIGRGKDYTAEGFDIDPEPVAWGMEHNFAPLGEAAERATLHLKDVRAKSRKRPDVRAAQNFSYFVFQERAELLDYCRSAYEDLADDGVFVMDIYGGPDALCETQEVRKIDEGFTYVWDQETYWPATGEYRSSIHFRFKDGTKLKRAFRYRWRLWFLTEVMDVLRDAGFQEVETYWEGTDEDGESGNGIYRRSRRGENCEAWVTYIVGIK